VVTPGTIKWYNKQIYRKLGVNSRTKAIAQANKAGLFNQSLEITSILNMVFDPPHSSFIGPEQEMKGIQPLLFSNELRTHTGTGR
jgi:hypothetical protein